MDKQKDFTKAQAKVISSMVSFMVKTLAKKSGITSKKTIKLMRGTLTAACQWEANARQLSVYQPASFGSTPENFPLYWLNAYAESLRCKLPTPKSK